MNEHKLDFVPVKNFPFPAWIFQWVARFYTKERTPKKALVAWEDVTYPRAEGGLGIIAFRMHVMALKMHWVFAILTQDDLQWVQLAHQGITRSFKAPSRRAKSTCTPKEMVLLDPNLKIKRSTTLKGILSS